MRKIGTIFKLLLALTFLGVPYATVQGETNGWQTVGTGIDYQVFSVRGKRNTANFNVYVARMDRANQNTFIESGFPAGSLSGSHNPPDSRDTIRNMAGVYDEALNYWGEPSGETYSWGGRNHVVVAINGDFQVSDTVYQPEKGQIHFGWYDRRYRENTAWSGFVWAKENPGTSQPNKRSAFIGECVRNPGDRQYVTFANNSTLPILGLNVPRSDGQLIVYTPDYGSYTPSNIGSGVEVVVQMDQPAGVVPYPAKTSGTVVSITTTTGHTLIPFDAVVLSGTGTTAKALTDNIQPGDRIGVTQEISALDINCNNNTEIAKSKDWTNAYASIGGSYAFLRNGTVDGYTSNPGATEGAPRTAIAMNDNYIYFIVSDGVEAPGKDDGLSYAQMGNFAKNTLQATWGIMEDGGGSSTMVVNGQVKNKVTDCENSVCYERAVVNGIMMVVQEPMQRSRTLSNVVNQEIHTTTTTELRLGPGTNYGSILEVPAGKTITIRDDGHVINGVLAKGSYWWKAQYGNFVGWLPEAAIDLSTILTNHVRLPAIFRGF